MSTEELGFLYRIIQNLKNERKNYETKPNPSQFYIQKLTDLINGLSRVYNNYPRLEYLEAWIKIERSIQKLESEDKQLTGHNIFLRRQRNDLKSTIIPIDLF